MPITTNNEIQFLHLLSKSYLDCTKRLTVVVNRWGRIQSSAEISVQKFACDMRVRNLRIRVCV